MFAILPKGFCQLNLNLNEFIETSYFDQFNMTKNGFEYDRMKFTPTNVNDRM